MKKNKMTNIGQKWLDILIPFANDYNVKFTSSDVSKKVRIPKRTVSRIFSRLVKINWIRYVREGRNKKYYFDLDDEKIKVLLMLIENYKALKFSLEYRDIFLILEELMKLKDVILFGSYAKDYATEESDVDILIIGDESEKIRKIVRRQIKDVNVHFSNIGDFEKSLKKKNVLATEIMNSHIVFGSSLFVDLCWRFYRNEI